MISNGCIRFRTSTGQEESWCALDKTLRKGNQRLQSAVDEHGSFMLLMYEQELEGLSEKRPRRTCIIFSLSNAHHWQPEPCQCSFPKTDVERVG